MSHRFFTSESVTEGHPDKICDQISDAVLDAILAQDPLGRVACETTASTGLIHIMGEISTHCYVDIPKVARQVIREIGYDRAKYGFDCDTCGIITNIDEQSADIALGVDRSAAYAARWVAKNVVAAGLAKRCQIQLAYAIGVAQPVSILVETFGTGTVSDEVLEQAVRQTFDLRPTAIIRDLDLQKPIYQKLAAYGHMGREDLGVAWEKTDRAAQLKAACQ